jgi:Tfp pilus assembly protein PilF
MATWYTTFAEQQLGESAALKQRVLESALMLAPYPRAYNSLAALASDQGDCERATQLWKKSLALNPDQAEIYAELCKEIAQNAGQRKLALYYFEQTLRLQPKLAAELKKWLIQNDVWH